MNHVLRFRQIARQLLCSGLLICFALSTTSLQAQDFNQVIKAVAADRAASDYFGSSVAISGDYAIVGAYKDDLSTPAPPVLTDAGSAYIFERTDCGNWAQVQKIVASDGAAGDNFGYSVAISGNYAIVGADEKDQDALITNSGAAYIFERAINGNWSQIQKIVAPVRHTGDHFGYSVAISGSYVLVGSPYDDGSNGSVNAGSVDIFERGSNGTWTAVQEIEQLSFVDTENANFGNSVAVSGNYAVVEAYLSDYQINFPDGQYYDQAGPLLS